MIRWFATVLALSLGLFWSAQTPAAEIAAAANLRFALEAVADSFAQQHGVRPRVVYGGTGHLARQMIQGAPFELLIAADQKTNAHLYEEGMLQEAPVLYAEGHLVLIFRKHFDEHLRTRTILETAAKIAIANPLVAPYGLAAQTLLSQAYSDVTTQGKIVLGENVSQATQFVVSGAAEAGFVSQSLASAPAVRDCCHTRELPRKAYPSILQSMGLRRGASPLTRRFYQFMQSPEAQLVMSRYGYSAPPRSTR